MAIAIANYTADGPVEYLLQKDFTKIFKTLTYMAENKDKTEYRGKDPLIQGSYEVVKKLNKKIRETILTDENNTFTSQVLTKYATAIAGSPEKYGEIVNEIEKMHKEYAA